MTEDIVLYPARVGTGLCPVPAGRSPAAACGHSKSGFAIVAGFSRKAEGGCCYVLLGAECSASIAAFTFAETSSVSRTLSPAVGMISPTRISSGWHLMW